MVFAQTMFAVMNVFSRLGSRDAPWTEVAGARFLFGALVAILVAGVRGTSLRAMDQKRTWMRSICGTLASLGFFYAITNNRIALGDANTLGATAPIFVALLSVPLLGERVGRHVSLAVALAFIGVVGVVQPSFQSAGPVALMATGSALFYALAIILLRKIGPSESSEAIVLHFSVVAAITMFALSVFNWKTPNDTGFLYMLATGLTGGLGQVGLTRAYALSRAAPMSALSYLSIVFTHLLAVAVFDEQVGRLQLAGAGLVILAGVILTYDAWTERREARVITDS